MLLGKLNGREVENRGWTEVRGRRNTSTLIKGITSFFFSNMVDGINSFDLKEVFRTFRRIRYFYIIGRIDKRNSYFGFVKFGDVKNSIELERSMKRVNCGHCILKVSIAKYEKMFQIGRKHIGTINMKYVQAKHYSPTQKRKKLWTKANTKTVDPTRRLWVINMVLVIPPPLQNPIWCLSIMFQPWMCGITLP